MFTTYTFMTIFMISYKNFTLIAAEGRGRIEQRGKGTRPHHHVIEFIKRITKCNLIGNELNFHKNKCIYFLITGPSLHTSIMKKILSLTQL